MVTTKEGQFTSELQQGKQKKEQKENPLFHLHLTRPTMLHPLNSSVARPRRFNRLLRILTSHSSGGSIIGCDYHIYTLLNLGPNFLRGVKVLVTGAP